MITRLAYVINNLTVGGAEKLLLSTVKKLSKEKYDITVCSMLHGKALLKDFEKSGVKVVCLNMHNKRDIRGFFKLYHFFKSNKIDIVHTHLLEADLLGRFAAILANVPVIISTDHRVDDWRMNSKRLKTKIRFILNRIACNHSKGIIAVADNIKNHLIKNEKINPVKIYVIKNGIEIQECNGSSIRKKKGDTIVLGNIGRLSKEKGHEYLLKAFKQAKTKCSNIKLLVAGDGPLRLSLEKFAHDLDISADVTFLGVLDDIPAFLNKIDIFVLSSLQEGLPIALLEAMAAEKPIIATTVGGIPEVVENGLDGILVDAANVHELKHAIISVIQNEDKRGEMGQNAQKKVEEYFDLDNTVDELESLYDNLLKN